MTVLTLFLLRGRLTLSRTICSSPLPHWLRQCKSRG